MITEQSKLPHHIFNLITDEGMTTPTTEELFKDQKVVVFAVPGAFTPTCSAAHLPGFITHYAQFKEKGVDRIICLSVNDAFVMRAWGEAHHVKGITMLADGDGAFTTQLGLEKETGAFGGVRSKRYAMVVNDLVVEQLFIEKPKEFEVSSAQNVLQYLSR